MIIGAEAKIEFKENEVIKERIKKGYRLKELDERIRRSRTKREARIMAEASRIGVRVPKIIEVDEENCRIRMERIHGENLRDVMDSMSLEELSPIFKKVGEYIGLLHSRDIIHGDLTTGNLILKDGEIWIIDFGLAFFSPRIEDKAVDLHLLKEALRSRHPNYWEDCFNWVIEGYKEKFKGWEKVLERMKEIEERGRYRRRSRKNFK